MIRYPLRFYSTYGEHGISGMILFSVMVSRLFQLRFFIYKTMSLPWDCLSAPSSYNNPKGKFPIHHHWFPKQKAINQSLDEVRASPSFGQEKVKVEASFDLDDASPRLVQLLEIIQL